MSYLKDLLIFLIKTVCKQYSYAHLFIETVICRCNCSSCSNWLQTDLLSESHGKRNPQYSFWSSAAVTLRLQQLQQNYSWFVFTDNIFPCCSGGTGTQHCIRAKNGTSPTGPSNDGLGISLCALIQSINWSDFVEIVVLFCWYWYENLPLWYPNTLKKAVTPKCWVDIFEARYLNLSFHQVWFYRWEIRDITAGHC